MSDPLLEEFIAFYREHFTRHDWTEFQMWGDFSRRYVAGPSPRPLLDGLLHAVVQSAPMYVVIHEMAEEQRPLSAAAAAWLKRVPKTHIEARELPDGSHYTDGSPCIMPGWIAIAKLTVDSPAVTTLLDGMAERARDPYGLDTHLLPHLLTVFGAATGKKLTVLERTIEVSAPWSLDDEAWAPVIDAGRLAHGR